MWNEAPPNYSLLSGDDGCILWHTVVGHYRCKQFILLKAILEFYWKTPRGYACGTNRFDSLGSPMQTDISDIMYREGVFCCAHTRTHNRAMVNTFGGVLCIGILESGWTFDCYCSSTMFRGVADSSFIF